MSIILICTLDLVIVHTRTTMVPHKMLTFEHVLACNEHNTKHPPHVMRAIEPSSSSTHPTPWRTHESECQDDGMWRRVTRVTWIYQCVSLQQSTRQNHIITTPDDAVILVYVLTHTSIDVFTALLGSGRHLQCRQQYFDDGVVNSPQKQKMLCSS